MFDQNYEAAPATKLLATNCAVCGRALVDAESVETGIGPICRAKVGFDQLVSNAAREEANKLVYQAAAHQKGVEVHKIAQRLLVLGFEKLAAILLKRAKLKIEVKISWIVGTPNLYRVEAPYSKAAIEAMKAIEGRFYREVEVEEKDAAGKVLKVRKRYNFFPSVKRSQLFDLLRTHYAGLTAEGPRGPFVIDGATTPTNINDK